MAGLEAFVEVASLSFRYAPGLPAALDGLSFTLPEGKVLGILGENGAGKSTLALALAGIIPKALGGEFSGKVTIAGEDISRRPLGELVGLTGLVLQNPFNQITGIASNVFDEIAFGPQNLGWPAETIRAEVERVIDKLRIRHLAARNPLGLSGGEQQRVAIASILVIKPKLLILDEPTSQLDPAGAENIFQLISELRSQGNTIILIEHKVEAMVEVCDQVIVLNKGRIAAQGRPADVLGRPEMPSLGVKRLGYALLSETLRQAGRNAEAEAMTSYKSTVAILRKVGSAAASRARQGDDSR